MRVIEQTVKIEAGIPIPKQRRKRKYPFDKLKIGESLVIPEKSRQSAYWAMHRLRIRLTLRRLPDGSYRVWRTA